MELERKTLPFRLKADGPEGSFRAVFSTFDVLDHDGDITRPGAFKADEPVIVGSWGHKTADLPVGKGVIISDQREAAVEGAFFLDTTPGKDTYQTVKNLGDLGEWSYVFSVMKQSFGEHEGRQVRFLEDIKVYSVDPVLAGAGIGTRTTDIKGLTPFTDDLAELRSALTSFGARVKARAEMRATDGRPLSAANRESLKQLDDELAAFRKQLDEALQEPKANDELVREILRAQHILARLPAA